MLFGIRQVLGVANGDQRDDVSLVLPAKQLGRHGVLGRLAGAGAEEDNVVTWIHSVERVVAGELAAHVDTVANPLGEDPGGKCRDLLLPWPHLDDVELNLIGVGLNKLAGLIDDRTRHRIRPAGHFLPLRGVELLRSQVGSGLPVPEGQRCVFTCIEGVDWLVWRDPHHPEVAVVGADIGDCRVVILVPKLLIMLFRGLLHNRWIENKEALNHSRRLSQRLVIPVFGATSRDHVRHHVNVVHASDLIEEPGRQLAGRISWIGRWAGIGMTVLAGNRPVGAEQCHPTDGGGSDLDRLTHG